MENKKYISKSIFIGLSFIIFILLLISNPLETEAGWVGNSSYATLRLSPYTGVYKLGNTFSVDVYMNTYGQNIVVASIFLEYDPAKFEVISYDTTSSVFYDPTGTKEIYDDSEIANGKFRLTIGKPTPGVNTSNGKVATIVLKGMGDTGVPSSDNFTFDFDFSPPSTNESNLLLEGEVEDVLKGVLNAKFSIDGTAPPKITNFNATGYNGYISLSWTNPTPTLDFDKVKILRKTTSSPANPNDGSMVYEGTGESYQDYGLINGITYYYAAFSKDDVGNYSSGVTDSAVPRDPVAPAKITNLLASSPDWTSITLNWTAVGNDGTSGTAASYDIRYSASTITDSNWSSAHQVNNEPDPKSSGNSESMQVTGLESGINYYFAIKAIDEGGNTSSLSNITNEKTYRRADLHKDYYVNSQDFAMLMSNWGDLTRPSPDINQDGNVDSLDFAIMMTQWSSSGY